MPHPLEEEVVRKRGSYANNAGHDNQSCHILTVIFNRIEQLGIPKYNLYPSTLYYTNISIPTGLRVCGNRTVSP